LGVVPIIQDYFSAISCYSDHFTHNYASRSVMIIQHSNKLSGWIWLYVFRW